MRQVSLKPLFLTGSLCFLVNCSMDISIDSLGSVGHDFLGSTVVSTSRGKGDGQTNASVRIQLKNSDGTPVPNYKPDFDFQGAQNRHQGLTFSNCTLTDDQGFSTCTFRSITPGSRQLVFNDLPVDLSSEVIFDPLGNRNSTFFNVVSGALVNQTTSPPNGNYRVSAYVGKAFGFPTPPPPSNPSGSARSAPLPITTSNGWKINTISIGLSP